jgi:hypothetical protein
VHSDDLPASQPTRPWALAMIWAAVAYVALLVVHLSRDSAATAAYRSGEVLPMALLSGVAIAVLAGATRRRWPWWAIALGVLGACAIWYPTVHVLPRRRRARATRGSRLLRLGRRLHLGSGDRGGGRRGCGPGRPAHSDFRADITQR